MRLECITKDNHAMDVSTSRLPVWPNLYRFPSSSRMWGGHTPELLPPPSPRTLPAVDKALTIQTPPYTMYRIGRGLRLGCPDEIYHQKTWDSYSGTAVQWANKDPTKLHGHKSFILCFKRIYKLCEWSTYELLGHNELNS